MPTGWTREYKPKNFTRHCRPLDLTPSSNITLNPEEYTTPQDQPKVVTAKKTYKETGKTTTVHEHHSYSQLPTTSQLLKNTLEQLTIDLFVCGLLHKALKPM